MPPDGSTAIMGRSQTATEDSRIPHTHHDHHDTMDSEPVIPSSTPTSESDVEKDDASQSQKTHQLAEPRVDNSRMQSEKAMKDSNSTTMTQRKATTSTQEDKKEGEVDVMDIPATVDIVWRNVLLFIYLHVLSAYFNFGTSNVANCNMDSAQRLCLLAGLVHICGALGITCGAHRYWAHKSFKAKLPLKLILVFMQTVSFQNSIHEWSRDHRVHHKYSETNADPHNARRGFFFAHMGWLVCRKHPAVKEKGKQIDMSDLEAEPLIMFQKKYYTPLVLTISFFMPTFVAWYFWGENFITAWCFAAQLRYCFNLHCTWLVNSAAHLWGDKPYDKTINPSENLGVAIFAFGEGWHNYHHVFPWDYKTAELGHYKYNFTCAFIDFFAWVGWAYDLKTVSDKMVRDRVRRTGDGSWREQKESANITDSLPSSMGMSHGGAWGWGDADIDSEMAQMTQTLYPLISLHED